MERDEHGFGIDSEAPPDRGRTLARAALYAGAASLAAIWVLAAVLWPKLPERIPMHFGASGAPDRWAKATALNWFMLPLAATGVSALMAGVVPLVRRFARTRPALVNVPRKKDFMRLPADERVRVLRPMEASILGFMPPFNLLMAYILWNTYAVAVGLREGLPAAEAMSVIAAATLAMLALPAWGIFKTRRAVIDAAAGLASDEGAVGSGRG